MDFSFIELLVVGVIAFLVLGPKDLARYAQIAGRYFGRFKAYANNLKIMTEEELLKEDDDSK